MWYKFINWHGDAEGARFAIRRSSMSVYSISYPQLVQRNNESGGDFSNHLEISIGDLLVSFNQGIDAYGELDMYKFHFGSAAEASDRIHSGQGLTHCPPGDAHSFFHFLFKQPVYDRQEFSGGSVREEAVVPDVSEVLVGYMGDKPFDKIFTWQNHLGHFSGIVVEIFEGDGIAVIGFYPGFADGRTFEVFSEVVNGCFPVRGLFVEMYNPVFVPEGVEQFVQFFFLCEMRNGFREAQSAGVELVANKFHDCVLPETLQDAVEEVEPANPFSPVCGKPSGRGGKVNVIVPFEIPTESVDCKEYAGEDVFLFCQLEDDIGGLGREHSHQVPVCPDDELKIARDGEGDMLPDRVWQPGIRIGDPLVCRLFPAGWAKSRLAGVWSINEHYAFRAEKPMEPECLSPADKQFDYIDDDGRTHEMAFLEEEIPPVAVVEENIPYSYFAA